MLNPLPPHITEWTTSLPKRTCLQWEYQFTRLNTETQANQLLRVGRRMKIQGLEVKGIGQVARVAVRLATILGERDYLQTTAQDLQAYADTPSWQAAQVTRHNTAVHVTRTSLLNDLMDLNSFLRRLYQTVGGMSEEDAAKKTDGLMGNLRLNVQKPGKAFPLRALSPSGVDALKQTVPALPITDASKALLAFLIHVLAEHGARASGMLRSKLVHLSWHNDLAAIAIPPGYKQKACIPLFLDKQSSALLLAYLAHHTGFDCWNKTARKPDEPLFLKPDPHGDGDRVALDLYELRLLLRRACLRARITPVGPRAFRKTMTTQAVVGGADMPELQQRLGHSVRGTYARRYTVLTLDDVCAVARNHRGGRHLGRYTTCCRRRRHMSDIHCTGCGSLQTPTAPLERGEALGLLGLECISDQEQP